MYIHILPVSWLMTERRSSCGNLLVHHILMTFFFPMTMAPASGAHHWRPPPCSRATSHPGMGRHPVPSICAPRNDIWRNISNQQTNFSSAKQINPSKIYNRSRRGREHAGARLLLMGRNKGNLLRTCASSETSSEMMTHLVKTDTQLLVHRRGN